MDTPPEGLEFQGVPQAHSTQLFPDSFPAADQEGDPLAAEHVPEVSDLLDDLRAFAATGEEAVEQADQPAYLDEEDVIKMKELIHEKPRDVIQWIEEEGVIKLGEFEVQVS